MAKGVSNAPVIDDRSTQIQEILEKLEELKRSASKGAHSTMYPSVSVTEPAPEPTSSPDLTNVIDTQPQSISTTIKTPSHIVIEEIGDSRPEVRIPTTVVNTMCQTSDNTDEYNDWVRLVADCPQVTFEICGKPVPCLLDTGAQASLVYWSYYTKVFGKTVEDLHDAQNFIRVAGANDREIPVIGYDFLPVNVNGTVVEVGFLIRRDDCEIGKGLVIIGCNALRRFPKDCTDNCPELLFAFQHLPPVTTTNDDDAKNRQIPREARLRTVHAQMLPPHRETMVRCKITDFPEKTTKDDFSDYVVLPNVLSSKLNGIELTVESLSQHCSSSSISVLSS